MKIAIIGYSGSGKSTLAARLGRMYGCPVLHLDKVNFLPGWEVRPKEQATPMVAAFMRENEDWIIDGNYRGFCFFERMEAADRIIFMNFSRLTCYFRARRRAKLYRGQCRESVAEGCVEKFDREFRRWLLVDGRTAARRALFLQVARDYAPKVTILRNQRQLDAFMLTQGTESLSGQ